MRRVILLVTTAVALSVAAANASEMLVPDAFPTIQAAVDAAAAGDVVLVAPGVYEETVVIRRRSDLTLRGVNTLPILDKVSCWRLAADVLGQVTISGSVIIDASERIAIEWLTITGTGPGIWIGGTESRPSEVVEVRFCNVVCNEEGALVLAEHYRGLSFACSNACLSTDSTDPWRTAAGASEEIDVLVTCSMAYARGAEPGDLEESTPVVVAVIDSGIDRTVPGLSCHMWINPGEIAGNGIDDDGNGYVDDVYGWDFEDEDADSMSGSSLHWHGTFVAGVIADVVGEAAISMAPEDPAPAALRLMDLRVLDRNGLYYTSDWEDLARAIDYAVANGAQVVNVSLYATQEPPGFVRDAFLRAVAAGVLIVGIAGNSADELGPISNWEEVMTVAALTAENEPALFSNVGSQVDVAALGVDVLSLIPGGVLHVASGTSFAAPRVAGLAVLHLAQTPGLTGAALEQLLKAESLDVGDAGWDMETGWGKLH